MHESALARLKRSFSGKFSLSSSLTEPEEFVFKPESSPTSSQDELFNGVCQCKSSAETDANNVKQQLFNNTDACSNCHRASALKKEHVMGTTKHYSFSSLQEDVVLQSDRNCNNLQVKMRSQSMNASPSRHIFRRFSTPSLALQPEFPYGKMESYEKLGILGEGSYAKVYKGRSKYSGESVALKEMSLNCEEGTPFTAIREISLLKTLNHANIVRIFDIIHTKSSLTIVFEFISTDLSSFLEKLATSHGSPVGMSSNNAIALTYQLLRGLEYCHKRKVLHRDLKPQNILLSQKGELKLADFGLARAKSIPTNTYSNEVVTLWYRPPDVLLGSTNYNSCLDIWGVGCIFLEMLTGMPIFPGQTDACDQLNKIFEVLGTPNADSWPGLGYLPFFDAYHDLCFGHLYEKIELAKLVNKLKDINYGEDFAMSLLQYDPKLRLTATSAKKHAMFNILPSNRNRLADEESIATLDDYVFENEIDIPDNQDL